MTSIPEGQVLLELKQRVGFGPTDELCLRALGPIVQQHFARIGELFYQSLLEQRQAREGVPSSHDDSRDLQDTIPPWLSGLFSGPREVATSEHRGQVGRLLLRNAIPQHFLLGAMGLLRTELISIVGAASGRDALQAIGALNRLLDLEQGILLHGYREALLAQTAKAERLSVFGQLAGSLGHELRNPLGVIETSVFLLRGRTADDERLSKHLDRIAGQVVVANHIITQLLDMIHDRPLLRQRLDVGHAIHDALGAVPLPAGVSTTVVISPGLPAIDGDPTQLRQVLVNLVQNAAAAMGEAGTLRLEAHDDGGRVLLAVEDSGPGLPESIRSRLFEPLLTTKPSGIGLGLALVRRIVVRHQGSIHYGIGSGGGALFTMSFPKAAP